MADNSDLSDLMLVVGGDITPLEDALAEIPQVVQNTVDEFAAFMAATAPLDQVTDAAQNTTQALNEMGQAASSGAGLDETASGLQAVGTAAASATPSIAGLTQLLPTLSDAEGNVTTSTEGMVAGFAGLYILREVVDAMESLAEDALTAAGNFAKLTESLTMLTGSAADTQTILQGIESISLSEGFEFNSVAAAAQKMTAFGISAEQIPSLLQTAADAAAATGNSFDSVANALARVYESGTITTRQLVQLGVTIQDLADYAGLSIAQMTAAMKKGVLDGQTAIDLLQGAAEKYAGAANAVADTVTQQFKILQAQVDVTSRDIGQALTPFAQDLINAAESILPSINSIVDAFKSLSPSTQAIIVTLGELAAVAPVVALAIGTLSLAWTALEISSGPIGIALAAIGAALVYINFKQASDDAGSFVNVLKENLPYIQQELESGLKTALQNVLNVLLQTFPALQNLGNSAQGAGPQFDFATAGLMQFSGAIDGVNDPATRLKATITDLGNTAQHQADVLDQYTNHLLNNSQAMNTYMQQTVQAQQQVATAAEVAARVQAAAAATAAAAAAKWNTSWDQAAQKAVADFVMLEDSTGDTSGALSKLNSVILNGTDGVHQLNSANQGLLTILQKLAAEAQADKIAAGETAQIDKIQDEVTKLGDQADLTLSKIPTDFQAAMTAVANGQSFSGLDGQITSQIAKINQMISGIDTANMSESDALVAQNAIDIGNEKIANLQQAKADLDAINGSLKLIGQDTAIAKIGDQIQGFVTQVNLGKENTDQINLSLGNLATDLTKTVIPSLQAGATVTPKFVDQLMSLNDVVPGLGTALAKAAIQGVQPFTQAVLDWQTKIPPTVSTVNAAFQSLGSISLQQAQNNVQGYGNAVIISLSSVNSQLQQGTPAWNSAAQDVIGWAAKVIPDMQEYGSTIGSDVIAKIALISPAVAQAAQSQDWQLLQKTVADLAQQLKSGIQGAQDAYQQFGVVSIAVLDRNLAAQQSSYNQLVAMGAPLGAILTAQQAIYNTQLQIGTATNQDANTQLQIAENLEAVKAKQDALNDSTNYLANLYINIDKEFATAYQDLGKGIADAIVSGQNFGAAFTKVFADLKTKISELVVNTLLGQFKDALIQDTNWMNDWSKAFNAIFGGGASGGSSVVNQGLANVQTVITDTFDEMGNVTKNVQTVVQQASTSTTSALQQVSNAAVSAAGNLLNLLGDIGSIVSAIASLFSAIELAHTNTLLDRIANNTLGMLNVLGTNGSNSILGATLGTWQQMQALVALMWNPIGTLLFDISSSLDDIKSDTASMMTTLLQLAAAGATTGGGGNAYYDIEQAANAAAIAQENAANQISTAADSLTDSAASISYAGTAITSGANVLSTTASTAAVAIGVMAAVAASVSPQAAQALSSGGIGASLSGVTITPVGSYTGPVGAGVAGGVGSGAVNLTVNVQAGVVAGQNGMQQLATMVGQAVVTNLRRNVSLLKA